MSIKAMKISHKANKRINNPSENYSEYLKGRNGERRLIKRLNNGRKIKPCGRECEEHGLLIAKGYNHSSFENFKDLMDNKEFVLKIVGLTPNPVECENYFYKYVNKFLKKDKVFK